MADLKSTWSVQKRQLDALSIADARRLRSGLLGALNRVEDNTSELFEPLLFLVEQSLMERRVDTLEAFAVKVEIALQPGCENDPELTAVKRDAEGILRAHGWQERQAVAPQLPFASWKQSNQGDPTMPNDAAGFLLDAQDELSKACHFVGLVKMAGAANRDMSPIEAGCAAALEHIETAKRLLASTSPETQL